MQKFTTLTGIAAPLPIMNIDTDMIIPKQYLKTIARTGLGKGLFSEMRYREDGAENPDFVLNKPVWRGASILIAGDNFGCGSSREHAPQGLLRWGIKAIVATSYAEIFAGNSVMIGLVCATATPEASPRLDKSASQSSTRLAARASGSTVASAIQGVRHAGAVESCGGGCEGGAPSDSRAHDFFTINPGTSRTGGLCPRLWLILRCDSTLTA